MEIIHFIGIDISKSILDWAVYTPPKGIIFQTQSANSEEGIKATIKTIKALSNFEILKSVWCMEHNARCPQGSIMLIY
ncbi:IS110 family transposase [Dyadobacter flavalbus]|uniref:IS110 family transposase n=1 Tax=Dyadobacter flavalbus TaxID=2579942 RepID=UPI001E30C8EC|nr:IS110 family transposase [Dyadobacter flavalbus]